MTTTPRPVSPAPGFPARSRRHAAAAVADSPCAPHLRGWMDYNARRYGDLLRTVDAAARLRPGGADAGRRTTPIGVAWSIPTEAPGRRPGPSLMGWVPPVAWSIPTEAPGRPAEGPP